jgi:uncharacterized protein DUF1634
VTPRTSRLLSTATVALFGVMLALGLFLYLLAPSSAAAAVTLNAGILILIASPAVRIAVATAEEIRRRDWGFVLMTAVICAELLFVLWRAAAKG